ncbi:putative hydro-lyase [Falsiroseomonas sp. HC035]|uniref:putative hydro-lyase n=1 Tax=Falsiroseomonas sp. HC035 TaxID=3390999 RepID=UPI003D320F7E
MPLDDLRREDLAGRTAAETRAAIRAGQWRGTTHDLAGGYIQANLAILPEAQALDFLRFCLRNPKPCPLLDVTDTGSPEARQVAPGSDLRTDLSRYRIYRHGQFVEEVSDLRAIWRPDHVGFVMGCSLSFDAALEAEGIPARSFRRGSRIPTFTSSLDCIPAGPFRGPMVVSLKPIPPRWADQVRAVTARYPATHGGPVHVGNPAAIGVDPSRADWTTACDLAPDEVPMFWGCGVTPQAVAMAAGIPEMITHSVGHMFLTDLRLADLRQA